ncbi:MAG: hypothetical protein WC246_02395 [Candidatus Paceibacterota bacterium]|jgi:hypothetical protein
MAIIIHDEEQKNGTWFGFVVALVPVLMIGIAAYYVFFMKPDVINQVAPLELRSLDAIRSLQFDPQSVVSTPSFTGNQQSVSMPQTPIGSNAAPFGVL